MLCLGGGVRYIWDNVYLFDYFVDLISFLMKVTEFQTDTLAWDCDFMTICTFCCQYDFEN